MEYGIQMYPLRDIPKTDYESAIRAVAEIGYKKI